MNYALRFVWHVAKIVLIALSAFAILAVAFFVAMDSANVYVIVTDGMKARAETELVQTSDADPSKYFDKAYLDQNPILPSGEYRDYVIKDIDYKIAVESLWCQPWKNTATVTVVESIPDMTYDLSEENADKDKTDVPAPQWQRARYRISCKRENDAWRITGVSKVQDLLPEPSPTPEPKNYISASPVPTSTPTASVTATPTPSPFATGKK